MSAPGSILVVSAHAGDFVWRCGGAIALHAARGDKVHVVCVSLGVNGESTALWKRDGATRRSVAGARSREARAAAKALGADVSFLGGDDFPLIETPPLVAALNDAIRSHRPTLILTHTREDPANTDHATVAGMVLKARLMAGARGHGEDTAPLAQVACFEPQQPELCHFDPDLFLDISDVWEHKCAAFEALGAQQFLWDYYTRLAQQRGEQAGCAHAEAYQSLFPRTARSLL